jgi:hypothetical protein
MSNHPSPLIIPKDDMKEPPHMELNAVSEEKSIDSREGIVQEWSEQEEYLLALWSDRALCYKLMSERASRKFHRQHLWFSIPVIILSTLCGSANLAVQSYVPTPAQSMASAVVGCLSLGAGVITTLQTFFASAQKSESHRNSSTSWGKLHRLIYTELSLQRNKRKPVKDFMRQAKNEYDRILDQSPTVPSDVLRRFVVDIRNHPSMMLPEECGNLLHTQSWEHIREQRLAFLEIKDNPIFLDAMSATP